MYVFYNPFERLPLPQGYLKGDSRSNDSHDISTAARKQQKDDSEGVGGAGGRCANSQTGEVSFILPCCWPAQALDMEKAMASPWRELPLPRQEAPPSDDGVPQAFSPLPSSCSCFCGTFLPSHSRYAEWVRREVEQYHEFQSSFTTLSSSSLMLFPSHHRGKNLLSPPSVDISVRHRCASVEEGDGKEKREEGSSALAGSGNNSTSCGTSTLRPAPYRLYHSREASPPAFVRFIGAHDVHGVNLFMDPVIFRLWMPSTYFRFYPQQERKRNTNGDDRATNASRKGKPRESRTSEGPAVPRCVRFPMSVFIMSFRLYSSGIPLTPPVSQRAIASDEQKEVEVGERRGVVVVLRDPVIFPVAVADVPGDTVVHCSVICYTQEGEDEPRCGVLSPSPTLSSTSSSLVSSLSSEDSLEALTAMEVEEEEEVDGPVEGDATPLCPCIEAYTFAPLSSVPVMSWHTSFPLYEPHNGRRVVGACCYPFHWVAHNTHAATAPVFVSCGDARHGKGGRKCSGYPKRRRVLQEKARNSTSTSSTPQKERWQKTQQKEEGLEENPFCSFAFSNEERVVLAEDKGLLRQRWEGRLVPPIPWLDTLVEKHLQRCRAEADVREEMWHPVEKRHTAQTTTRQRRAKGTTPFAVVPPSPPHSSSLFGVSSEPSDHWKVKNEEAEERKAQGSGCLWIFLPVPTVPFPIFHLDEWAQRMAHHAESFSSLSSGETSVPLVTSSSLHDAFPSSSCTPCHKTLSRWENEEYVWLARHLPHVEVVGVRRPTLLKEKTKDPRWQRQDPLLSSYALRDTQEGVWRRYVDKEEAFYDEGNNRGRSWQAMRMNALRSAHGNRDASTRGRAMEKWGSRFLNPTDCGAHYLQPYPDCGGQWLYGSEEKGEPGGRVVHDHGAGNTFMPLSHLSSDEARSSRRVGLNVYEIQAAALSAASIYLFLGDTTAVPGPRERQRLSELLSWMLVYPLPMTTTTTAIAVHRQRRTTVILHDDKRREARKEGPPLVPSSTITTTNTVAPSSPLSPSWPSLWMRPDDVALLWRYRYFIARDGRYFLLFLSSVVWARSMTAAEAAAGVGPPHTAVPSTSLGSEEKKVTSMRSSFSHPLPSSAQRAAERMLSAWTNVISLGDIIACFSPAFQGVPVIRLFAIDALCRSPAMTAVTTLRRPEERRLHEGREEEGKKKRSGPSHPSRERVEGSEEDIDKKEGAAAAGWGLGPSHTNKSSNHITQILCLYALPLLHCTRYDTWDGRELSRFLLACCCGPRWPYSIQGSLTNTRNAHGAGSGSGEADEGGEGCWPLCAALYWGSKVEGALEQKYKKARMKNSTNSPRSEVVQEEEQQKALQTDRTTLRVAGAPLPSPPWEAEEVKGPFTWLHENLRSSLYQHAPSFLLLLEQQENLVMRLEMLVSLLSSTGKSRTEKIKRGKAWLQGRHGSLADGGFSSLFLPSSHHCHSAPFPCSPRISSREGRKVLLQEKIVALRRERRRKMLQKLSHPELFYRTSPMKEEEEKKVEGQEKKIGAENRRNSSRDVHHRLPASPSSSSPHACKEKGGEKNATSSSTTSSPHPCEIDVVVTSPSHPNHVLANVMPEDFYVFKSSKQPIRLSFLLEEEEKKNDTKGRYSCLPTSSASSSLSVPVPSPPVLTLMFKTNDDTRQDAVVISLLRIMDHLLQQQGLDLCLTPYSIQATSPTSGLIEVVPHVTTLESIKHDMAGYWRTSFHREEASCTTKYGAPSFSSLPSGAAAAAVITAGGSGGSERRRSASSFAWSSPSFFSSRNPTWKTVKERYIKSVAGYCVITYLLGVGDRHLENILIASDGRLLHIDFGFLFGRDPKPFAPLMKLGKEMVAAMGGEGSAAFQRFQTYCCRAYHILRQQAALLLYVLSAFSDAEDMPQVTFPAPTTRNTAATAGTGGGKTSLQMTTTTTTRTPILSSCSQPAYSTERKYIAKSIRGSAGTHEKVDGKEIEEDMMEEEEVHVTTTTTITTVKVAGSVEMMRERLRLDLTNAQATQFMLKVISDSVGSRLGQLIDLFHSATQATKD